MTALVTTLRAGKGEALALCAATAFTVVALVGAALWLVQPEMNDTAARGANPVGVAPRERFERQATAAARHALSVPSPDDIPEVNARFVERHQALDGSTPLAVTVVVSGALPAVAHCSCGAIVGPVAC